MSVRVLVLILLIVVLVAVLPTWPHSRAWGPYPSSLVALLLVVLLVFLLLGYL